MSDLDAAVEAAANAIHHVEVVLTAPECFGWECFTCGDQMHSWGQIKRAEVDADRHRLIKAVEAAAPIAAAQALRDAAEGLRADTCGEHREGIARWSKVAQDAYELAIDEAKERLRERAHRIEKEQA